MRVVTLGELAVMEGGWASPGTVRSRLSEVDAAVSGLDRDMSAEQNRLDQGLLREWLRFVEAWRTWRDANSGAWAQFWGGTTMDELNTLIRRYNAFEQAFVQATGRQPSQPAPVGSVGTLERWKPLLWTTLAISAMVGAGYLISTMSGAVRTVRRA